MERNPPSWYSKSLDALLGASDTPDEDSSPAAIRFAELGRIPIVDLANRDLAYLLRQHRGVTYLLPLAIDRLRQDLWADADLYPGHLLLAALRNRGRHGHLVEIAQGLDELEAAMASRIGELAGHDRETFERERSRVLR